jgi:hypothetical protein
VPVAPSAVKARVFEQILIPDLPGLTATDDLDHGHLGVHGHTACCGEHGTQRAGGAFDRVDALTVDRARDRHGGAVARDPGDQDLRVRGLGGELFGDDAPHGFGRVARGLDPSRIGDEDEAGAVDLHLF